MALLTDKTDFQFSTQGRSGTPDGNIYLDTSDPANPKIELFSSSEVVTMAGSVTNLLDPNDGATMQAIYGAIGIERKDNEAARQFLKPSVGVFALAGSYDLLNNWQFSTTTDLGLVRSSGIRYLAVSGSVNRIYFGPKSLGNIESLSQPYYQTASLDTVTDFSFTGDVDELVQVFGTTSNGDTGAGNFDVRSFFAVSVREWGFIHDRKTLVDSGLSQAAQFSGGFGLSESPHPTTGSYTETEVLGGGAIAPWSTMNYLTEATTVSRTGFNEVDGDFAESIENPAGGTLDEVVAYMDALARSTSDIDSGTPTQIGKQVDVLYTFDAQGNVVLKQGLFIENLPGADLTRLRLTDDAGNPKTFPSLITINVNLSSTAQSESTAWYHSFIENDTDADDYNTAAAITSQDKDGTLIKGTVSASSTISWDVNYSAAPGGTNIPSGTPYQIRFIVGDDPDTAGGPVENFVLIDVDGSVSTINVTLPNEVENNI
jgi:hypothetical protein